MHYITLISILLLTGCSYWENHNPAQKLRDYYFAPKREIFDEDYQARRAPSGNPGALAVQPQAMPQASAMPPGFPEQPLLLNQQQHIPPEFFQQQQAAQQGQKSPSQANPWGDGFFGGNNSASAPSQSSQEPFPIPEFPEFEDVQRQVPSQNKVKHFFKKYNPLSEHLLIPEDQDDFTFREIEKEVDEESLREQDMFPLEGYKPQPSKVNYDHSGYPKLGYVPEEPKDFDEKEQRLRQEYQELINQREDARIKQQGIYPQPGGNYVMPKILQENTVPSLLKKEPTAYKVDENAISDDTPLIPLIPKGAEQEQHPLEVLEQRIDQATQQPEEPKLPAVINYQHRRHPVNNPRSGESGFIPPDLPQKAREHKEIPQPVFP